MQPMVATVQTMLNAGHERWSKLVDAMPEEALNWQPTASETNSIAQLVRHVTAVQAFLLTRALGEDVPHDHQYSLRNHPATRAELHTILDEANARKDDLLMRIDGLDLGEALPHPRFGQILRAWYVIHPADHGQEHLGHGELTAQLYAARHAAQSA